jgi:hypothetical protein
VDSITQKNDRIDLALLVIAKDRASATCMLISLPESFDGVKFAKCVQVGDEYFAETVAGDRFQLPDIDEDAFEQAMECPTHFIEIDLDGETGIPIRYEAEFISEEPSYRPGV